MPLIKRPHRKHFRPLWPGSKPNPSATTDDIPPSPAADNTLSSLARHPSDPTLYLFSSALLSASSPHVAMTGRATIHFSQPGLQPPVYVVTSLSSPPWQPLELNPTGEKTTTGDTVFARHFDHVAAGTYQYKIRLGEDHWIVDESTETATDDVGNRNNVIHVKPETQSSEAPSASAATAAEEFRRDTDSNNSLKTKTNVSEQVSDKEGATHADTRKDSALDVTESPQLPIVPVPFVVVEKVVDKDHLQYGNMDPESLSKDGSKRAADAEPDFEEVRVESPVETQQQESSPVPLVVVERLDSTPSHGDDFGENATSAQKLAHDLRGSDAKPDRIVVKHDHHHIEPGTPEEQAAPLFRHESMELDSPPLSPGSAMETIEEESSRSSPDQTGSEDVVNTSLGTDEPLAKEGPSIAKSSELDRKPWLSLEAGSSGEDIDELCHSPLMTHETFSVGSDAPSEGELDQAPLLPHEIDSSRQRSSFMRRGIYPEDDEDDDDVRMFESMRAPSFPHEDLQPHEDGPEAPLLSHEQDWAVQSTPGSDSSANEFSLPESDHRPFPHEPTPPGRLFSLGQPPAFRPKTNSSSLPHKLPRSDEEDENLHDPSLEPFPTSRDKIFEQVVTIGKNLPEDEAVGTALHSPHFTVTSQACSSVDLAPVRSYSSLQSVVEESPEEEKSDPPPNFGGSSKDQVADHTSQVGEGIATPSKVLDPPTPPLTPEKRAASATERHSELNSSSESRNRQAPAPESDNAQSQTSVREQPGSSSEDLLPMDSKKTLSSSSAAGQVDSDGKTGGIFQTIFGPIARMLNFCLGRRSGKQATTAVLVVGIAMAAYYVYVRPGETKSGDHSENNGKA